MIGKQASRAGSAVERSWRRRAAICAAVATSIAVVFAPPASAGLVEKVVDTVGSTVKSVQGGSNAPLSPPSTPPPAPPAKPPPPPAKPPLPAATPTPPPQAPAKLLPKLPGKEPSSPSSRDGAPAADPSPATDRSPVDRVGGAAQNVVDSVTRAGNEAASGTAATPERSDGAAAAATQHRVDRTASEAIVRRTPTASSPPVVSAAEVAALQRWLARVWPAVALDDGGVSGGGVVGAIAADLFRPALVAVTGLLLAGSPILPTSGDPPLVGHHGVAGASRSSVPNPAPAPSAADGGSVVYLIVIAGLLGLLAFTVWREFRIALRPGLH